MKDYLRLVVEHPEWTMLWACWFGLLIATVVLSKKGGVK